MYQILWGKNMNNLYVNPAYPLENSLGMFSTNMNNNMEELKPLDENVNATDILQLYYYSNEEKQNNSKKKQ